MPVEIHNHLPEDALVTNIPYKDWVISKWTGWKSNFNPNIRIDAPLDNTQRAQWIAWRPCGKSRDWLYVSIPGGEGPFKMGECFDINFQPGQFQVTSETSQEEKDKLKEESYQRMLRLIDRQPRWI